MEKHELSNAEWQNKAEAYCARAEHCAADVRRKFNEWGAPSGLFEDIKEKLYDNGFLDDSRFCLAYVHDKVEYQSWGRMKIQAGLHALQLPEREIAKALESIDETVYFRNLRNLIKSRSKDPEEKQMRFLLQRGFSYEEIKENLHS